MSSAIALDRDAVGLILPPVPVDADMTAERTRLATATLALVSATTHLRTLTERIANDDLRETALDFADESFRKATSGPNQQNPSEAATVIGGSYDELATRIRNGIAALQQRLEELEAVT
jgi:hypothetical protein